MAIVVSCVCGSRFSAKPELAGKQLACPSCRQPIAVHFPVPQPVPSLQAVSCICGARFQPQPYLAGKSLPCPTCGQTLHVPNPLTSSPFNFDPLGPAADLGLGQPMPLQSTGLPATMPMGGTTRSRKRKSGGNKTLWIALGVAVPVVLFGVIVVVALNSGNENSDPVATGDAKQQNQSSVTNSRENQPKGPAPQAIKKGSTETERTKPSQQTSAGNSAAGRNNSAIPAAKNERIRKALTAAGFEPFTTGKIELLQLTATTLKNIQTLLLLLRRGINLNN